MANNVCSDLLTWSILLGNPPTPFFVVGFRSRNQVPCAHVYHITFDNGTVVTATRNHTFYVPGGLVPYVDGKQCQIQRMRALGNDHAEPFILPLKKICRVFHVSSACFHKAIELKKLSWR